MADTAAAAAGVSAHAAGRPAHSHTDEEDDLTTLSSFAIDHQRAVEMCVDGAYERKVTLVNREIRRMGFGKFQWWLFFLSGGGWAVDNVRPLLSCSRQQSSAAQHSAAQRSTTR